MPVPGLIPWPKLVELLAFVCVFLAAGAVGFRYSAVRGRLAGHAAPRESRGISSADDALYMAAAVVLVVTAIVVSLPVPKAP